MLLRWLDRVFADHGPPKPGKLVETGAYYWLRLGRDSDSTRRKVRIAEEIFAILEKAAAEAGDRLTYLARLVLGNSHLGVVSRLVLEAYLTRPSRWANAIAAHLGDPRLISTQDAEPAVVEAVRDGRNRWTQKERAKVPSGSALGLRPA